MSESEFVDTDQVGARRLLSRLAALLKPYRWVLAFAMVLLMFSIVCDVIPWFIWKYVTDDLLLKKLNHTTPWTAWLISLGGRIKGDLGRLLAAMVWLFLVGVLGEIFGASEMFYLQKAAQDFIRTLRNTVYEKLQSLSHAYLQKQRTGELMTRVLGDVNQLQSFGISGLDRIFGEGVSWIVTIFTAVWMDWRVTLASLLPMFVVYAMVRRYNRVIKPLYSESRNLQGELSNRLFENLSGITVIKMFGRERQEARRFSEITRNFYEKQMASIVMRNWFYPLKRTVGSLSSVLMFAVAGYLILERPDTSFTVGKLIVFRAFWSRLVGPIHLMSDINDNFQKARISAARVFDVLDAPDELNEADGAIDVAGVSGAIEFRNVSFRYPGLDGKVQPDALRNVQLKVMPGKVVAFCGPSGAGKTTLFNLILRFYDPSAGEILLDGQNLREIRRESFRGHFALVQQETFLFNDTVLGNIRYARPEASMEKVIEAAVASNAHDFIIQLANGYQTRVGERGVRLSGGQKQRIGIARAFLCNPSVLLLDEPTSSVEPESEAVIVTALNRLMTDRTTIVTSHRPSLIAKADYVYVVENGQIAEAGTPHDLVKQNGWLSRFLTGDGDSRLENGQAV